MLSTKTDIWVYAHWIGIKEPKCIGVLTAHRGKGRKSFSFEYNKDWIHAEEQFLLYFVRFNYLIIDIQFYSCYGYLFVTIPLHNGMPSQVGTMTKPRYPGLSPDRPEFRYFPTSP